MGCTTVFRHHLLLLLLLLQSPAVAEFLQLCFGSCHVQLADDLGVRTYFSVAFFGMCMRIIYPAIGIHFFSSELLSFKLDIRNLSIPMSPSMTDSNTPHSSQTSLGSSLRSVRHRGPRMRFQTSPSFGVKHIPIVGKPFELGTRPRKVSRTSAK